MNQVTVNESTLYVSHVGKPSFPYMLLKCMNTVPPKEKNEKKDYSMIQFTQTVSAISTCVICKCTN
jgi:hypothetical protein